MGVTFIAKEGTYTAPATLTTKTITENGTYSAVDDSANGYSSVTVNVEGGGGSSDFSTAEVVVTNNGEAQTISGSIHVTGDYLVGEYVSDGSTPATVTAVLYKGVARWVITTGTVSVTGNATTETTPFGTGVVITGDCTITIS